MFITEIGNFDGDSWETFCQGCFKQKYSEEGYQEIPADTHGDMGIEGFTSRTGKVFQCYCPDNDTTTADLHTRQKNKITTDLEKLETYQNELVRYLKDYKIKEWIFVTPKYRNKELIAFCKEKEEEFRKRNLPHIDPNFEVLVHNWDFYIKEAPLVLQGTNTKIDLTSEKKVSADDVIEWKSKNLTFADNAIRKFEKVLPKKNSDIHNKVNQITTSAIQGYLTGNEVLRNWQSFNQPRYEMFLRVIAQFESNLPIKCALNEKNNSNFYKEVEAELEMLIAREFPELHTMMIRSLCHKIFYGWILECPLEFE